MTVLSLRAVLQHPDPAALLTQIHHRIAAHPQQGIWIHRATQADTAAQLRTAAARRDAGVQLPLFGVPFAVKDNIDTAGMPTTAACPAYAYMPERSAPAVQRLLDAGAICFGKTNMDQFATGLSGVRSPYGACASVYDPAYASGGSSSGSAVAVAAGLVSFALGTDTGGSGRIPAGFNGVVGVKPTPGLVSSLGMVPACRSFDCVSVFALDCADGAAILNLIAGYDPEDPFSSPAAPPGPPTSRIGYLACPDLDFEGDDSAEPLYQAAITRLRTGGLAAVQTAFAPFREAGTLMFEGPWAAERLATLGSFIAAHPDDVLPVIRDIVSAAARWTAAEAFAAAYRLRALRRQVETIFRDIDALVVPTAPRAWTFQELEDDPIARNNVNGRYSYCVNLLGLCAIAVPAGRRANGIGMGVTLIAPAWHDARLARLGALACA